MAQRIALRVRSASCKDNQVICPAVLGESFTLIAVTLPVKNVCLSRLSRGDTVLIPFAGSGTAGVVSVRHGQDFSGISEIR